MGEGPWGKREAPAVQVAQRPGFHTEMGGFGRDDACEIFKSVDPQARGSAGGGTRWREVDDTRFAQV